VSILKNYSEMEYLIANGLGGSSSACASGLNTRRYHSILSAALNPPVNRRIFVSRASEIAVVEDSTYILSTLKTVNGFLESGYENILSFKYEGFPVWEFKTGSNIIEKSIFMIKNRNMSVLFYKNIFGKELTLTITPYFNDRDVHSNTLPGSIRINILKFSQNFVLFGTNFLNSISLKTDGEIQEYSHTLNNVFYDAENERGLFAYEEIISKVRITKKLHPQESFYIIFGANDDVSDVDPFTALTSEKERIISISSSSSDNTIKRLLIAADTFIMKRKSTGKHTIIAGFPWFTDWGRDTMIALEGLLLYTRNYSIAKEVIENFVNNLQNGLIPNVFDDYSGQPKGYNTADATLWLFYALYKYYTFTHNDIFLKKMYPYLYEIIKKHISGTDYNIHMDDDYLIYAGNKNTQLTWMDVKVEDWSVTPRYGKTVEVNALWFNALNIMTYFSKILNAEFEYEYLIEKVKSSFNEKFWNSKDNCLYDVINEEGKDFSFRPNQIFAVSLPFDILSREKERLIIDKVLEELYIPYGLRTLSPKDPRYIGIYVGDRWTRDGAYHQGNAWPYLLGHFLYAFLKINDFSKESKVIVKKLLAPIEDMINTDWCGTIPEIIEGNWPHEKKGCFSQAWSVGEILRIILEVNK